MNQEPHQMLKQSTFSCDQRSNVVPQYCNFNKQIAVRNLQPNEQISSLNSQPDLQLRLGFALWQKGSKS